MTRVICDRTGKISYAGKHDAKRACTSMRNRFRIYFCDHCHLWHVTHEPKGDRRLA